MSTSWTVPTEFHNPIAAVQTHPNFMLRFFEGGSCLQGLSADHMKLSTWRDQPPFAHHFLNDGDPSPHPIEGPPHHTPLGGVGEEEGQEKDVPKVARLVQLAHAQTVMTEPSRVCHGAVVSLMVVKNLETPRKSFLKPCTCRPDLWGEPAKLQNSKHWKSNLKVAFGG